MVAEMVGTALLLAAVVGSGIMGERLAGGNVAIALLANTLATGAVLMALILAFGPISAYITGAYRFTASTSFANPAVTLARSASDTFSGIRPADAPGFILVQLAGAAVACGVPARAG
jgi:glycerol uptake facilitator-like aquaporin